MRDMCGRLLYQSTGLVTGSVVPAAWSGLPARSPGLEPRTVLDADSSSKDPRCYSISEWNRPSLPFVWGCLMRAMTCLMPISTSLLSNTATPRLEFALSFA